MVPRSVVELLHTWQYTFNSSARATALLLDRYHAPSFNAVANASRNTRVLRRSQNTLGVFKADGGWVAGDIWLRTSRCTEFRGLGVGIAMSVALGRLALNLQPLLHQIIDGKITPGRRDDVGTQSCKVVPVISGPEKPSVRK
ncbi:hypothetical protein E4U14_008107 [Claviceps sp. LM454 group G7]|nr:hypothetical protein E4U14_008107 [Claviceps sp. LM454 group G7]